MTRLLVLLSLQLLSCTTAFQDTVTRSFKAPTRLQSLPTPLDTLTSGLASICRLPHGVTVDDNAVVDGPYLVLWDIENNADCRRVRERLTELNLETLVFPCAEDSSIFVGSRNDGAGPKNLVVPGLSIEPSIEKSSVLPNLVLAESSLEGGTQSNAGADAILEWLEYTFGSGERAFSTDSSTDDPKTVALDLLDKALNSLAGLLRFGRGTKVKTAILTDRRGLNLQPLILYSYEGNQFCRLVREVLAELDLVYVLKNTGKGSPRRDELAKRTGGSTQCPYLVDPNTGTEMAESAAIIQYLYKQYAKWTPPSELLQWASDVILPAAKPLFAALAPLQAGSNNPEYRQQIAAAKREIQSTIQTNPIVIYTYDWSPFSQQTKAVLDGLNVKYKEVCLGAEWVPGLIKDGGATTRAALLEDYGQSSLPHIFVGGQSIGGIFSGTPGLIPSLEDGSFEKLTAESVAELDRSGAFE